MHLPLPPPATTAGIIIYGATVYYMNINECYSRWAFATRKDAMGVFPDRWTNPWPETQDLQTVGSPLDTAS